VLELLRWTTRHFASKGIETARLDAECLLARALGTSRLALYVDFEKPVMEAERAAFRELVRRRASDRVPVSHLLGEKEFWSLPLRVTADVLTPRPDTETLVSAVLDRLPDRDREYEILDLGTGSGAIALALASERPRARVTATDISPSALQIAVENAEKLRLRERLRFLEGELYEPLAGMEFDAVVSNPPYLASAEAGDLAPELAHEPKAALFAGEDGLDVLRPLIARVGEVLRSGGWLAVEIDPRQVEPVRAAFIGAGLEKVEVLRDLASRERGMIGQRP
jgi:release factor glutamine methyltransferase